MQPYGMDGSVSVRPHDSYKQKLVVSGPVLKDYNADILIKGNIRHKICEYVTTLTNIKYVFFLSDTYEKLYCNKYLNEYLDIPSEICVFKRSYLSSSIVSSGTDKIRGTMYYTKDNKQFEIHKVRGMKPPIYVLYSSIDFVSSDVMYYTFEGYEKRR